MNPAVCAAILRDYINLSQKSKGAFHTDLWAVMHDFDELFRKTLTQYPILECIAQCKILGYKSTTIQKILE